MREDEANNVIDMIQEYEEIQLKKTKAMFSSIIEFVAHLGEPPNE